MDKLEWSALEYEERDRSPDWFWALGIIVVTSSIAAIIFGNYFFAALLVLSGVLLGFLAIKKPETILYEINNKGVKIKSHLYLYENIKSFWVQIDTASDSKLKPTLFIKTERVFIPVISIPIDYNMADDIHTVLTGKGVIEEEMTEHASSKIMESLGF